MVSYLSGRPLWRLVAVVLTAACLCSRGAEPDVDARLEKLERVVATLLDDIDAKDARIAALEAEVHRLHATSPAPAGAASGSLLDRMVAEVTPSSSSSPARGDEPILQLGPARLMQVSAVLDTTAGTSSADHETIGSLQGGGHDPKRRGFTLQGLELSLAGAVDPYFTGEAHVVISEDVVELEEAFATTSFLPYGLEIEAGYMLTEFGRINPTHLHSWQWIDQPVISTRLFGGDGMRGTGLRLGWLTPLPWYSEVHVGVQNAGGEMMTSFMGEGHSHAHGDEEEEHEEGPTTVGGRPIVDRDVASLEDMVYLLRWVNGWDASETWSLQLGASALLGPNNTGPSGHTAIYGADLVVKWRAADQRRGWPYLTWQTEVMQRHFHAASFAGVNDDDDAYVLPEDTLTDWGMYSQVLWGFRENWAVGLRGEYASGSGGGFEEDASVPRADDPMRADRLRVSPLIMWQPSEYSRLRLQYNYDQADFLADDEAHSLWLGLEILLGSHPAHSY